MFDEDLTSLSTAGLLESAAGHRAEANRLDARLFEHAQIFAGRHHPDVCPDRPGRRSLDGRERAVVLGGDGCPEIAEFAVAEFGLMLGVSPRVAAGYLGQALALQHRFPFTWAKVRAGEATPWRAGKIADACLKLSEVAARYVDKRVAGIVDSITPYRLDKIVKAAKMHADPDGARAEADENGTKTVYIRGSSGGVTRFDASIASIADALRVLGDTRSLDHRRAVAVEIMADPHYMIELLLQAHQHPLRHPAPTTDATDTDTDLGGDRADAATEPGAGFGGAWGDEDLPSEWLSEPSEPGADDEADREAPHPSVSDLPDPLDAAAQRALDARLAQIRHDAHTDQTTRPGPGGRLRPGKTEIYVHLTDHTLATGTGVLRAEGIGPLLASQLSELVGHGPYVVKPVIDLNDAVSVDAYEIPDRIRERVKLTHPVELFPYGNRETNRGIDLDHIQPYDPLGPPGQTSTSNLAPLGRFPHRVKTHGRGWNVQRLNHQTLEWRTPHGFTFHVDPTGTRRADHPAYGLRMNDEIVAYFWEQEDAETVAARLHGAVQRGRFHGEDDDEDHPWVVVLTDVDQAVLDELLAEYDGWLESPAVDGPAVPPPLPDGPRRFKRT